MNKIYTITSTLILLLVISCVFVPDAYAGTLNFTPSSKSVLPNTTFTVDVVIDAGTDQVAGSDIYVNYDGSYLELQSVTNGSYFPKTSNIPTSGRLYISGVVESQGEYKTGLGTVATLSFKTLQTGNTTVRYDCNLANTETSKIVKNDINATNVINCGGNGSLIVDISTSASGSSGGSSGSSGSSGGSSTGSLPSNLPASGVYENMMQYSLAGFALLIVGIVLRLAVRV